MPAAPGLTLRLLGAPSFAGAGSERASELLAKPKALALLAHLAVARSRGLRHRDEILALLWPESDEARARNSLRQGLFLLRTHLPPGTLVGRGRDEIGLAAVDVDVAAFEEHLDGGRPREALALYAGALLDGFRLSANSGFDAWLAMERERLHRRAMRAAMVLADSGDGDGRPNVAWARFAVDRSPYDEDLLREAIALFRRQGDREGAAALYDAAVARFRADLGIALSPETERAGRVVAGERRAAAAPAAGTTPEAPATPPPAATPRALRRPHGVSPEARRHYLEARQLAAQKSPVTIVRAIAGYERAIELSPEYAEAHSGLGFALCQAAVYVAYPGIAAWPRAKAHASRAIRLDPRLGEGHAVLAHVTLCYDYEWERAGTLYRTALELDPISAVSRQLYALYYLTGLGRTDEALAVLDRARDDFPNEPGISVYCGLSSVMGRRFEGARREAEFVLDAHPGLVQAHWVRGMALEGMGDFAGAIRAFETGVAMTNRSSLLLSQLGRACASAGDHERARSILAELDRRGEDGGPGAYFSAEILAALGSTEPALDRLYAAYRQRNAMVVFSGVMFGLDPLRGTRRFRDLLMRIGLPAYGRRARAAGGSAPALGGADR